MGKKAKEHRKKIAKRNEQFNIQKKKAQKIQEEFLMQLIEQEKQKGLFNSPVTPLPIPGVGGPTLGMPIVNGPQI
jgi:hypothetical protein